VPEALRVVIDLALGKREILAIAGANATGRLAIAQAMVDLSQVFMGAHHRRYRCAAPVSMSAMVVPEAEAAAL
jgi:ABC-type branched-subunit amino acid transport system ATPase component